MRVLYVAFYFPPTSGGGVERTLRFCEHLPEHGIECEVVAPVDARWLSDDPASLARIPDGLRVHRVRFRGPANRVLPADRLAARRAPSTGRWCGPGWHRSACCCPTSTCRGWPTCCPTATRLLRTGRFDALLTTSPPHSVTVAGGMLARRTGLPWVADWRDPWLANPDVPLDRRVGAREAGRRGRGWRGGRRRAWPARPASTRRSPTRCARWRPACRSR